MSAKFTDWFGLAFSEASVVVGRRAPSFSLGLWQSTHCSIWLRFSPWSERNAWHWLHFATATTVRRGATGEPSTEKFTTLLTAPYSDEISFFVPGFSVIPRRASMPML